MWLFLKKLFGISVNTVNPVTNMDKKDKIMQIVNVFETGTAKGDYSNISIFADGPGNCRQITYGRSQTTEYGNLKKLIEKYISNNGIKSSEFKSFVDKIGKTPLVNDSHFKALLKEASKDPIMIQSQDEFFDEVYWKPAVKFFTENKFTQPLSMLVIYDSYIHSGGILDFLRKRFNETPPVKGGNEQVWIKQYLNTRKSWLAGHSRPILRKTVYRCNNLLKAVDENNWDLSKPFIANGTTIA